MVSTVSVVFLLIVVELSELVAELPVAVASVPSMYVPCIMLGEGEWESDVKEGGVEAYKHSAVVVVGLY